MTKSTGLFDNDLNHSPQKNKIIGANLIFKFIFSIMVTDFGQEPHASTKTSQM